MTVQHIAVPAGQIPGIPPGATATVHSRELPQGQPPAQPQNIPFAPPPAADPLAGLIPNQPAAPAPAAAPAAPAALPGVDPQLLALLAGMTQQAQTPAATAPAQAPAPAPTTATVAPGVEGALRGVLTASGVDIDRALANALEYGNAALIDFNHIREKGGANAAQLEAVARSLVEHAVAEDARNTQTLYARAGGEQNFNAAAQAFNASAPEQVKLIVKALVDSGQEAMVMQGVDLMLQYSRGATMQPAQLLQAGGGYAPAAGLSREDFQTELQKLDRSSPQYEGQRQELFARRAFGKNQGL